MKKSIKNLFLLLLLPICFACSNEEPAPVTTELSFEEKMLGTWQLVDRVPHGIEFCELSNFIRFSPPNEFLVELNISDDAGGCRSASTSGTWKYLENNQVEIHITGIEGNSIVEITFLDNAKALKLVHDPSGESSTETYAKQ